MSDFNLWRTLAKVFRKRDLDGDERYVEAGSGQELELDADLEVRKGKISAFHSGFLTDPHFLVHETLLFWTTAKKGLTPVLAGTEVARMGVHSPTETLEVIDMVARVSQETLDLRTFFHLGDSRADRWMFLRVSVAWWSPPHEPL